MSKEGQEEEHEETLFAVSQHSTFSASPSLAEPCWFSDVGPLAWKRVENCATLRQNLSDALKTKWKDATTGPQHALNEMVEGGDGQFRRRLFTAQGQCKELKPFIEAAGKLLGATCKDSRIGT